MRQIQLIWVGKTQDTYLREGLKIYEKKIRRYCRLQIKTIKEANYQNGACTDWVVLEDKRITHALDASNHAVLCHREGTALTSPQLADRFSQWGNQGISRLSFILGGPFGTGSTLQKKSHFLLSLSTLTFTHQMVRLILMEQIYRAFTILHGEKYHH